VSGEIAQTFHYDPIGRIIHSSTVGNYGYGASPVHGVTSAGPHQLTYDASGNAETLDKIGFEWDEESHLVAASTPAGPTTWGYAANGRRTFKSSLAGTTFYFDDLVEEGPAGRRTIYKVGGRAIATRGANGLEWLHSDLVGSTRAVSDTNGEITLRYDYAPFGEQYRSGSTASTPLTYRAERYDEETGLILLGSRYYHPQIGRFVSADSIVPDHALPQSLDRYAFVLNSPVRFVDPTGHVPDDANAAQADAAKAAKAEPPKPYRPAEHCDTHPEHVLCRLGPAEPPKPIEPSKHAGGDALSAQRIHDRNHIPGYANQEDAFDAQHAELKNATNIWNLVNEGTWVEQARWDIGERTGFNAAKRAQTGQDETSRVLSPKEIDEQTIEAVDKLTATTKDAMIVSNVVVGLGRASVKAAKEGTTRVGRWMSETEFETMSSTGRIVEGAGGRTYVVEPPNPQAYPSARPGSVYAEFDVPSASLHPASKPEWKLIPGPNVTTTRFGPPPPEMPAATDICLVCRK
jgi:RHS repeat-associated protein